MGDPGVVDQEFHPAVCADIKDIIGYRVNHPAVTHHQHGGFSIRGFGIDAAMLRQDIIDKRSNPQPK